MRNFLFLVLIFIISTSLFSQQYTSPFELEVNYFYGNILRHNKDIASLIKGHPEGVVLGYNRKTYGLNEWERRYNYPDWGFSFAYQNLKNSELGNTYNFMGHFNFYFLNRKLMFRVAQGIGYNSNPFDIETNISNNAYGSSLFSSTVFMINYKQSITPAISLQGGLTFLHGSNGNSKAPNTGSNSVTFNLGLIYKNGEIPDYIPKGPRMKYKEPIHFNISLQSGLNESDYLGLGRESFLVVTTSIDKTLSKKSKIVFGVEAFFSKFLKNEIAFLAAAFPQFGVTEDQDWKRVGIFLGHELQFNKMALLANVGYYVYYPYDYQGKFYQRVGLKRYFGKQYFGSIAVKTHGAKAEAVEFGLGIRL
ncbi:acyloxyacyl hydrolase [Dokdonia sp. Hel_I_53]|uniref:acyloxyacyl hydrolase n=1 Tax=Dokdonia sp. Hel_I_53 TaxID=1566287 RepID=UPI00119B3230|nr:acyloxyacyl hydrolase [Dokdonia sp. Hel_I_53]TVZ51172.1 lipid A 3-O-deacylase PagL [Dokdonia sp. Hel_I_53]